MGWQACRDGDQGGTAESLAVAATRRAPMGSQAALGWRARSRDGSGWTFGAPVWGAPMGGDPVIDPRVGDGNEQVAAVRGVARPSVAQRAGCGLCAGLGAPTGTMVLSMPGSRSAMMPSWLVSMQ